MPAAVATAPQGPQLDKSKSMVLLSEKLPTGWEAARDYSSNRVYYIDHNTKTTTFVSPTTGTIVEIPPHSIQTADDVERAMRGGA